jgi:hypothetical protein
MQAGVLRTGFISPKISVSSLWVLLLLLLLWRRVLLLPPLLLLLLLALLMLAWKNWLRLRR